MSATRQNVRTIRHSQSEHAPRNNNAAVEIRQHSSVDATLANN